MPQRQGVPPTNGEGPAPRVRTGADIWNVRHRSAAHQRRHLLRCRKRILLIDLFNFRKNFKRIQEDFLKYLWFDNRHARSY